MDDKLREIHRKNAIKNGLGGIVLVDKVCSQCNSNYKGISNQLLCKNCKDAGGYLKQCKHCHSDFYSKYKETKYCNDCSKTKAWLVGKRRSSDVGNKISKSKLKFYKTNKGKQVAKNIGRKNSIRMKEYYQTDAGIKQKEINAIKQSEVMRNKIKCGEFIPNITNTFTHWDAYIELDDNTIKRFRSSWEACFWYSNQHLLYEYLRIPYLDEMKNERNYIADFVDDKLQYLYEIKPKKYYLKQKHKMDCIINYCMVNDIKFIWINEFNIINYINDDIFKGNNRKQLDKLYSGVNYVK